MPVGATDETLSESFDRGEILRTHVLRPTWHFVTPTDIRWLLELTGPRIRGLMKYYVRQAGLDADDLARAAEAIAAVLEDGEPRLRSELADATAKAGVDPGDGVRLSLITMDAEIEGIICSGPRRGKQHTYALIEDRAPGATRISRDQSLAELAGRYFRGHGPATRRDLGTWASLTLADVGRGIELAGDSITTETDENGIEWLTTGDEVRSLGTEAPGCLLTPMYDETVMGYKQTRIVFAVQPHRSGMMERPVVIDGLTVGSWKRLLDRRGVTVEATLFKKLDCSGSQALRDVVERFGAFLQLPATLQVIQA